MIWKILSDPQWNSVSDGEQEVIAETVIANVRAEYPNKDEDEVLDVQEPRDLCELVSAYRDLFLVSSDLVIKFFDKK